MTRRPRVVYVTRENPRTGIDELLVFDSLEEAGVGLRVVRAVGSLGGTEYLQAALTESAPPEWDDSWITLAPDLELPDAHRDAFVRDLVRERVLAYVTRELHGRTELLTIEAVGYPEDGLQVPAGRLDLGETLEEGLFRELDEEAGFTGARVVRELPEFECTYPTYSHNHAFHLVAEEETPDAWEHRVNGDGTDAGMIHLCRWVPLRAELELWNGGDPMLRHLPI